MKSIFKLAIPTHLYFTHTDILFLISLTIGPNSDVIFSALEHINGFQSRVMSAVNARPEDHKLLLLWPVGLALSVKTFECFDDVLDEIMHSR